MFRITDGKGFHITFKNGYTLSVQFGPGNYCDNYNMEIGKEDIEAGNKGSRQAEVAIIAPEGVLIDLGNGDTVDGYLDSEGVYKYIKKARNMKPRNKHLT